MTSNPDLAEVPRERTAGGVHLYFLCYDLPAFAQKSALTVKVNEKVTAELFYDGQNIVVAPSVHSAQDMFTCGKKPVRFQSFLGLNFKKKLFLFPQD